MFRFRWNNFGKDKDKPIGHRFIDHFIYTSIELPVALIEWDKVTRKVDFNTSASRYIERKIKENV